MSKKLGRMCVVATAIALSGCQSFQSMIGTSKLDQAADQLKTALAGEPVVITKESGSVRLTSSADYLYPSGGWQLRPGTPVLSKMVPTFVTFQNTKIVVGGYTDN